MHRLILLIPMGRAACGQDAYQLPAPGQIELAIYNLAGQQVAQLVCDIRPAGRHAVRWDGRNDQGQALASGVYLYRLRAGDSVQVRKLLLLK